MKMKLFLYKTNNYNILFLDSKKKIDIHLTITIKKLIYTLKILKQLNFEENYDNYQKKLEVLLNVKKIY